MKSITCLLLFTVAILAAGTVHAASKPPVSEPGVLHITVVESVTALSASAFTDFDRMDLAFEYVAKKRRWPVKVVSEKLVSNTPDYNPELRVVLQAVRLEMGDFVFRGWATLMVDGKKHDYGIVRFNYTPRMNENMDDAMDKVFRGAATAIAEKVEPVLFPQLAPRK